MGVSLEELIQKKLGDFDAAIVDDDHRVDKAPDGLIRKKMSRPR
jgi:hypothetical protein